MSTKYVFCNGNSSMSFSESLKNIDLAGFNYDNIWIANYSSQQPLIKLKPEKIIFQNNYATIVYWNDGTKTVVKKSKEDEFIPEVGFAMALVKRMYGNRSEVLKWIENAEIKE